MRIYFGTLIDSIVPLIAKHVPSIDDLKKYLERCFPELKPELYHAKSFDDVIDIATKKCTIIDIVCLEAIVDRFNIKVAVDHIIAYKTAIDLFCDDVKLSVCCNESFKTASLDLLTCETIQFILDWEADKFTLRDIKTLLMKAFKEFGKNIQVITIKEECSITIICYASHDIMDILMMEGQKNLHLMRDMGLIKLTVGYFTIWDKYKRDEVRKE